MSRYIDYDAIDYRNDKLHDKSSEFLDGVIYMAERIENAPSLDLVRCAECKHWTYHKRLNVNWCRTLHTDMKADDFCSYAERKESE